jgi:hypothetical protein
MSIHTGPMAKIISKGTEFGALRKKNLWKVANLPCVQLSSSQAEGPETMSTAKLAVWYGRVEDLCVDVAVLPSTSQLGSECRDP